MPRLITVNENVLGGTPVIAGTRIPIERVEYLVRSGSISATRELKEEYPHLNEKKLQGVVAYLMAKGRNALEEEYRQAASN